MREAVVLGIFGLDTHLARYGALGEGQPDLAAAPSEFDSWTLRIPFENELFAIL